MELRFDEDQIALQDAVRRFCADQFALDHVGDREGQQVDRARWRALGELGVFGLLLPELADGGMYGAVGAAIAFEELGGHLATGPLVWSALAAPFLAAAAEGSAVVGGLERPDRSASEARIEHLADLDALLVVAADGVTLIHRGGLAEARELVPLDPLTPVGALDSLPDGERVGGADAAARTRLVGTTLSAAMALGVASRALEVARAYALEREQFGAPIGSFQAVKHILADMYVRLGLARSATYAAAAFIDDGESTDQERAVAGAKLLAGQAALENAKSAVQVLGGMGFTWEMLPNYLLKRAWVLEVAFGTEAVHALTIAAALEGEAA
jgi:alkylation response protein AidB-like acyl-CoA dehydrogenase